jgi:hypothetical protein
MPSQLLEFGHPNLELEDVVWLQGAKYLLPFFFPEKKKKKLLMPLIETRSCK